ncbi:hypothetical protein [Prosthecobacter vanneervenii]|uniref:Uncharacterized protein n=1 Tax=Prosthecobacter vanneervenii TaxID=48466 RepID=A0A7W8DKG1_9BACT|nr:hypothetical protein [Prosthecobacter vanneervenii]MBB5033168.1 hypothetical protein [Prosthecobacter vanneervenii]
MALLIPNPYDSTFSAAFALAKKRGLFPTWMGTAEIRDLEKGIRERAVFSARTTNAVYLDALKQRIERFIANGYDGDMGKLRLELKDILTRLQYDPVKGFPGDESLGIPPARAGSLQDLSSDKRINLILNTQVQLMAGKGQEQQGLSEAALDLFPAYELVRLESRRVPREWLKDWKEAAENIEWEGVSKSAFAEGRMIALKNSPIWAAIGSSALFNDALDVSHPPFRFNSGMGWQVRDREAALKWGLKVDGKPVKVPAEVKSLPPETVSTHGLSAATLERLKKVLANAEAKDGKLTLDSAFGNAPPPPRKVKQPDSPAADPLAWLGKYAHGVRKNTDSLCDALDSLSMLLEDPRLNAEHVPKRMHQDHKGKRCGRGYIAHDKVCRKAVDVLSGAEMLTSQEAADALDQAPHHHMSKVLRHWFDGSYKRLNKEISSKETQQLVKFLQRVQPTPVAGPLWRGLGFATLDELTSFASIIKSGKWPDKPLNAFSHKKSVAVKFASSQPFQAVLQISGSKSGRDMRPLADEAAPRFSHQEEVMFLASPKLKVKNSGMIRTSSGYTFAAILEEA